MCNNLFVSCIGNNILFYGHWMTFSKYIPSTYRLFRYVFEKNVYDIKALLCRLGKISLRDQVHYDKKKQKRKITQ